MAATYLRPGLHRALLDAGWTEKDVSAYIHRGWMCAGPGELVVSVPSNGVATLRLSSDIPTQWLRFPLACPDAVALAAVWAASGVFLAEDPGVCEQCGGDAFLVADDGVSTLTVPCSCMFRWGGAQGGRTGL